MDLLWLMIRSRKQQTNKQKQNQFQFSKNQNINLLRSIIRFSSPLNSSLSLALRMLLFALVSLALIKSHKLIAWQQLAFGLPIAQSQPS